MATLGCSTGRIGENTRALSLLSRADSIATSTASAILRNPESMGYPCPMPDTKALSDNQADDAIKAALTALGDAPGATVRADTALQAARKMLALLSMGLIMASVKAEQERD